MPFIGIKPAELIDDNVDLNGGTIDGITIGGSTAAAGTFTSFTSTGIDDNADATAITIDSNENVGIGTTSPNHYSDYKTLTLNSTQGGSIDLEKAGTIQGELWTYRDTTDVTLAAATATSNLTFMAGGFSERMRITSAGKVGIGTTSPSQELHVKGTSTVANFEGTGGSGFIQITDSDDATTAFIGVDAGKLKFQTSGSSYNDKMVIDTAGTIGVAVTPNTMDASYDGIQVQNSVWFTNSSNFSGFTQNAYYDGTYRYTEDGYASNIRQISGRFDFLSAASGTADTAITWSTPMTISNAGNVGIGTTSPGVPLDIYQTNARIKIQDGTNQLNIGLWDGANHRIEGDANRKLFITSYHSDGIHLGGSGSSHVVIKGNKVGIGGTTSPGYKIHVVDGGNTAMYIEGDQNGYTQGAICVAGDTSDTSGYRGQGMYMFNHGADTTWYIGGVYQQSDRFDICRQGSTTSFSEAAAQSTYSLATFSNNGNLSIDGSLSQNSDVSIKNNVQNLSSQLENINALRPVEYDRNDKLKAGDHEIGLIAQEVESLLPDLVGERNGLKTLDYARLSVILLKGLQELSAKVAALEAN